MIPDGRTHGRTHGHTDRGENIVSLSLRLVEPTRESEMSKTERAMERATERQRYTEKRLTENR